MSNNNNVITITIIITIIMTEGLSRENIAVDESAPRPSISHHLQRDSSSDVQTRSGVETSPNAEGAH